VWEELARVRQADISHDISAMLKHAGSLEPYAVAAPTTAGAAARALDAPGARAGLAAASELLHEPGRPDVTLRGVE